MTYFGGQAEREPISLSAEEFDVLWEHLNLGPMPLVIKVPSPGKTSRERRDLETRVWHALEARGLGRPVGLHPELDGLLRMFVRPEREVDARVWVGRSVRVLAVANGDWGAMATLSENRITLQRVAGSGLPTAVLGALPQHPAGSGHSVTMPSADLEAAVKGSDGSEKGLENSLRARGVRDEDATTLVKMFTGLVHTGNFGAAARDKYGKRCRPDRVVAFFDTEDGRYLQQRRASGGTEPWSTFTPTDLRRLTFQLDELLAEAVRDAKS
ncbi:ESX secretion-associated protein EspG [Umezawaea tangerina]|uniref:ESAT-6 protein secretion system EspG family protein n=1 Tax=Umezawaea tangerina TaxID=84725 RepID=A0A2T0SH31_9PSEU|nr:ESX secretion-associated protein EspG [Umezawaea tangerina]PRY32707.1 ESAT-6 protein secretion system EspG family protein [Umezawaea tangerina]